VAERPEGIVLGEGAPADLLRYVHGALLVDLWPELVLPCDLRAAGQPVVDSFTTEAGGADDQRYQRISPIRGTLNTFFPVRLGEIRG